MSLLCELFYHSINRLENIKYNKHKTTKILFVLSLHDTHTNMYSHEHTFELLFTRRIFASFHFLNGRHFATVAVLP